MPVDEVFTYLNPNTIDEVLTQAVLQAPVFGTRWRWTATRALAILRHTGGRKVPPPLQRMRSDDLLAAVFPAQVACQDNAATGDIEIPDHPLVFETLRDSLTGAMDLEGCRDLLAAIQRGDIEVYGRDTVQPSAFSHQILNAMPYAFLDDAPLEERRARAVSLRRALPEDSRDLGRLDPAAVAQESENAWPRIRDADELHDALLTLGVIPLGETATGQPGLEQAGPQQWFRELSAAGRAYLLPLRDGRSAWVAAERTSWIRQVYPGAMPTVPDIAGSPDLTREEALLALVRGWAECIGPFTAAELASTLSLTEPDVAYALTRLENDGVALRGNFRPGAGPDEFCDRRILARIHRSTINSLRSQVEPASPAAFLRFLFQWQHVDLNFRLSGEGGLLAVIEELQGFETAAGVIEEEALTCRLTDFSPMALDRLCLGGEVAWGRFSARANGGQSNGLGLTSGRPSFSRSTPITLALRVSLDWLLVTEGVESHGWTGATREALEHLSVRGASFLSEIVAATRRLPTDVEEALWTLAAGGRVTADGLEAVRQRTRGTKRPSRRAARPGRGALHRRSGSSRWSLLEPADPVEDRNEAVARQILLRYGVVFPELLARDSLALRWRDLVRVLRRLEARGEVRGGRFVSSFVGEQFALPEAVDLLRRAKNQEAAGRLSVVSACDPLNLAGIITPGERVPAIPGNRLACRDGVPVAAMDSGSFVTLTHAEPQLLEQARSLLSVPVAYAAYQAEQAGLATA